MKMRLGIGKSAKVLYADEYDIRDAETFGQACADLWLKFEAATMSADGNIGAVMEHLGDGVAGALDGATITIGRA
ncbi:MAG: hypothetical protein KIT76_05625 [Pseudolabrys sp.]|jgi:hypothetical protein|nr:hypothetical protein [Pseudolabrys sp.]